MVEPRGAAVLLCGFLMKYPSEGSTAQTSSSAAAAQKKSSMAFPRQCELCRSWISSSSAQEAHAAVCKPKAAADTRKSAKFLGEPSKRWVEVIELRRATYQIQWRMHPDVEQSNVSMLVLSEVGMVSAGLPGLAISELTQDDSVAVRESFTLHTPSRQISFRVTQDCHR